ncbi:hypothetical protein EU93_0452 [Prochlorococcus marinus str. MIT 9116]|uniref:Uncharacterized protein n=1 Tax=Prochlorococcus marinus str. MIT 9116 TaxID=167544 RepID=A0A0A1ZWJ5_PROMR|nr:hypothetical protein EU93_0452 [Prochlorococcus marinus str. MIT 9116]
MPCKPSIAVDSIASSAISTNANPLFLPVSLSRGREQFKTSPKGANNCKTSSRSARNGKLPTKILTLKSTKKIYQNLKTTKSSF